MGNVGPKQVVVVDDDAAFLRSVGRLLERFGYKVLLFSSAEALEGHLNFDAVACVILDINLGDASGIDLRLRLKAAGNPVPVIYTTGNDTSAVRAAAHQSGCLAYLIKPFSVQSLMEVVNIAADAP